MKDLKDIMVDEFQYTVQELLVRNKSILDQMTKFQDSNARINRSIVKAVTQCGCVTVCAEKQSFPEEGSIDDIQKSLSSHISGKLCENCRDMIEKEMGRSLFYLSSLCNTLDLNLYDIILKELDRTRMLGKYNLK